jgi:hypothetical protein
MLEEPSFKELNQFLVSSTAIRMQEAQVYLESRGKWDIVDAQRLLRA